MYSVRTKYFPLKKKITANTFNYFKVQEMRVI